MSSIAITGGAFSVYSRFSARGEDVALAANTPIRVNLIPRGGEAGAQPVRRGLHQ